MKFQIIIPISILLSSTSAELRGTRTKRARALMEEDSDHYNPEMEPSPDRYNRELAYDHLIWREADKGERALEAAKTAEKVILKESNGDRALSNERIRRDTENGERILESKKAILKGSAGDRALDYMPGWGDANEGARALESEESKTPFLKENNGDRALKDFPDWHDVDNDERALGPFILRESNEADRGDRSLKAEERNGQIGWRESENAGRALRIRGERSRVGQRALETKDSKKVLRNVNTDTRALESNMPAGGRILPDRQLTWHGADNRTLESDMPDSKILRGETEASNRALGTIWREAETGNRALESDMPNSKILRVETETGNRALAKVWREAETGNRALKSDIPEGKILRGETEASNRALAKDWREAETGNRALESDMPDSRILRGELEASNRALGTIWREAETGNRALKLDIPEGKILRGEAETGNRALGTFWRESHNEERLLESERSLLPVQRETSTKERDLAVDLDDFF